ncbi:MAG: thiamine-phosphate kinase [Flavobacteriales bacterium MED-G15]|jgi:thiamine-monophosphate kinase|nr:MAG: thiamine-phosphate kinase [Flavobacteriales bacterium MED-G15]|tara:strand:- start:10737 stop:11780 length:1044 start_codon:yes stop_codon:yes gene_type:complete
MFENKSRTPLSELGEFKLIEHLTKTFTVSDETTVLGVGDDAAVLQLKDEQTVVTNDLLIEGIHFDLTYVPLKHLGYKAVMVNLSDVYAMNAVPKQITVSIAVSNRFPLEALEELYTGIGLACKNYKIDMIGGDTSSSTTGLMISITAIGQAKKEKITYRSGAKPNDLLVMSGDIGGAYMGLQVLEREKAVFKVNPNNQPDLAQYSYCVERQLKPEARKDIIELLAELDITPNAMIDISDGLSSEIFHLCKTSGVGCDIYEEKLPADPQTISIAEEFKINSTTALLNGGEDYELLMAIKTEDYDKIKSHPLLTTIGHFTDQKEVCNMTTGLGQSIKLEAQGWQNFNQE